MMHGDIDFGGGDEIRFERSGKAGIVTLTRPRMLNALTHAMVRALARAIAAWEADPEVAVIVIRAEGRAFCAGGDIQHIYEQRQSEKLPVDFFADEYRLNAAIARLSKPYVALIDGIVMGGGVGVSCHGSHRVFSENGVFAMPEVGIGFFPDVGGSHLLPRLKGSFGTYLGLTGTRARHGDALWAGIATHAVPAAAFPELLAEICETGLPDAALKRLSVTPPRETDDAAIHAVAQHFSLGSLDDLVASLGAAAAREPLARASLDLIATRSPTSLAVAFRQIQAGAMLSMDECMVMEFRIVNRMLRGHDFYEGIRAAVIEKGSRPIWRPATLAELDPADIEAFFSPLPGGDLTP